MAEIKPPDSFKDLPIAIIAQIAILATSGFGVVVALAWNEVIKSFIDVYVKPYLGQGSGVVSLLIYAIGVTILAVLVTMQLSAVQRKAEMIKERKILEKEKAKKKNKK